LGLVTGLNSHLAIILVCLLFAVLLLWLQEKKILATDTLLGILAHAALAIGMVVMSVLDVRVDLHAYLFGDILTLSNTDIYWMYGGGILVLMALIRYWSDLVLMTLDEDLAQAEKVNSWHMKLLLMFLMSIVVAVSVQMVGILLVSSMLIIPTATARQIARTPEAMAILAACIGVLAVMIGISISYFYDTPSGPSIVTSCAAFFFLILPIGYFCKKLFSKKVS